MAVLEQPLLNFVGKLLDRPERVVYVEHPVNHDRRHWP